MEGDLKGYLHAYAPERTNQVDNATRGSLVAERLCRIDLAQNPAAREQPAPTAWKADEFANKRDARNLGEFAVAVLEFLAGPAGTKLVAAELAPARRVA